jgi:PAS domain-containing protein
MTERLRPGPIFGPTEMGSRIREFDWAETALGSLDSWPMQLKAAVERLLYCPLVSTLAVGPDLILIYNDAAASIYGDMHPRALGMSLPRAFPIGWESVKSYYERAIAGERVEVAEQALDTRGEGRETESFEAYVTPIRDETGEVVYIHMVGIAEPIPA